MLQVFTALVLSLPPPSNPELALLSSEGDIAELRFQRVGSTQVSAPVVRFSHADGSAVLGSVLPGTRVVVATANMQPSGDLSFGSALLRLESGKPARVLADHVAYGTRPLVTADGRVLVSRGAAGLETSEGRIDSLTIDQIDPQTAKVRTVFETRGFWAFLVGVLGREVLVYESTSSAARVLAVHLDTLAVRVVLPSMRAQAHDFVVDAARKRVLFTQGTDAGQWEVQAVSLVDGALSVLTTGTEVTLLPTLRADGSINLSGGEGKGLTSLEGKQTLASQGRGFERQVFERDGWWVGLNEVPSDFPSLVVVKGHQRVETASPAGRLDVAGVLP